MCSDIVYLIATQQIDTDTGGFVEQEMKKMVYADKKSISQTEYYQAATAGIKPEIKFVIRDFEYNGEELLEYANKKYNILKTYEKPNQTIELTCSRLVVKGVS